MAHYYGMWASSNSALTDAIFPDFQAGAEKGITGTISALCGSVVVGCQGIAGADQGFSFEQLVLDDEWLGYLNYIMEGFEVTEETIAADLIEHMADSRHRDTLFAREFWSERLSDPQTDLLYRVRDFVDTHTAGYQTPKLCIHPEAARELDRIYEAAVQELG